MKRLLHYEGTRSRPYQPGTIWVSCGHCGKNCMYFTMSPGRRLPQTEVESRRRDYYPSLRQQWISNPHPSEAGLTFPILNNLSTRGITGASVTYFEVSWDDPCSLSKKRGAVKKTPNQESLDPLFCKTAFRSEHPKGC